MRHHHDVDPPPGPRTSLGTGQGSGSAVRGAAAPRSASTDPAGQRCLALGLEISERDQDDVRRTQVEGETEVVERRAGLSGCALHRGCLRGEDVPGNSACVARGGLPAGRWRRHGNLRPGEGGCHVSAGAAGFRVRSDEGGTDGPTGERTRQPADVVLVQVGQDEQVQAPDPCAVEAAPRAVARRADVHDHGGVRAASNEDRGALPDVARHRDPVGRDRRTPQQPERRQHHDERDDDEDDDDDERALAPPPRPANPAPEGVPPGPGRCPGADAARRDHDEHDGEAGEEGRPREPRRPRELRCR